MECDDYRLWTSMFIDDELPEEDRRALFRHLGECNACWTHFRRLERLHGLLADGTEHASRSSARPLLQRSITIPVASAVLTVFLTLITGALLALSVAVADRSRSFDGSLYHLPEYRPPHAALSANGGGGRP